MSRLVTIHSRMASHHSPGMSAYVAGTLAVRGQHPPLPDAFAEAPVVRARVEHGRWLVDCPFCPSANLGDPYDPRFFCIDCGNATAGGLWLRVEYPAEREEIEGLLAVRPEGNRHWFTNETVKDLKAENRRHRKEIEAHSSGSSG